MGLPAGPSSGLDITADSAQPDTAVEAPHPDAADADVDRQRHDEHQLCVHIFDADNRASVAGNGLRHPASERELSRSDIDDLRTQFSNRDHS